MKAAGRVLVFGDDDRSLLATVRSLGRRGLTVEVAGCPPDCPTLSSRYIARVHTVPAFSGDGRDWIAAVTRILDENRFDLVIPCNDASILPLTAARAQLSTRTR